MDEYGGIYTLTYVCIYILDTYNLYLCISCFCSSLIKHTSELVSDITFFRNYQKFPSSTTRE